MVFCVILRNVKTGWTENDCSIKNASLKTDLSKFAFNLESYVRKLSVLRGVYAVDRFNRDGSISVEILAHSFSHELVEVEGKIDLAKKVISEAMQFHSKMVKAHRNADYDQVGSQQDVNYAAVEAWAKCISVKENMEIEIDFLNSQKEVLETILPISSGVVSSVGDKVSINCTVRYYDELQDKVAVYDVEGVVGTVVLTVESSEHREVLIKAQYERRQIELSYLPCKNMIRPDKVERSGLLVDITNLGYYQINIPF